jgi:AcrR family transcriptional regulator
VRPASPRLPAARRRQQLLEVALEVFADRGFHVASMNHVAEAAGVTKPVLYQHFRSKRDLYREVLTDVGQQLLDEISKATAAAASPREQVELGFGAYFRFVHRSPAAFRVLFGGGTRRDEEFAAQVAQVEAAVAQEIAALIDVEGLGPTTAPCWPTASWAWRRAPAGRGWLERRPRRGPRGRRAGRGAPGPPDHRPGLAGPPRAAGRLSPG